MIDYVELSVWQVGCAALLVVLNGVLSVWLRLRMERLLLIASIRTVVQLLLVGVVLEWVFRWQRWYLVLVLASIMTAVAGWTAASRNEHDYSGARRNTIVSVWISSWSVTVVALLIIFSAGDSWYQPQYSIPLLGMVLGNALNGISVGLNAFTDSLVGRRDQVEAILAIGGTRWEAAQPMIRQAVRTGLIPITNSMLVVGIVSLPGMMTGQLLSGMAPMQAVYYQIVVMFSIASATGLGTVGAIVLTYRSVFSDDHQLVFVETKASKSR